MPNHEYMIIANREGKAWDFACVIHTILGKKDSKYHLNEFYVKRSCDNEMKVKIKNNIRNSSANKVIDVLPYMKFIC
jgi:hypothetical protein